jgi:hypothetical protein
MIMTFLEIHLLMRMRSPSRIAVRFSLLFLRMGRSYQSSIVQANKTGAKGIDGLHTVGKLANLMSSGGLPTSIADFMVSLTIFLPSDSSPRSALDPAISHGH